MKHQINQRVQAARADDHLFIDEKRG